MRLLFSASDGAAFTWGRIPIGANDFALSRYTDDDTGADVAPDSAESNRPVADTALSQFSLVRDDEKLVLYIKAAQAVKPDLRFWANPWTPPVRMKTGFRKSDAWGMLTLDFKIAGLKTALPIWATEHQGGNYPFNPSGLHVLLASRADSGRVHVLVLTPDTPSIRLVQLAP